MKETELVLIFRELMSWDYSVPDFYFDKDLMLDRKLQEQLQETYLLPTRTFWRPCYFDSYREKNIAHPRFAKRIREYPSTVSDKDGSESERAQKPRMGVLVSCLRPFDAKVQSDFLKMDKLFSKGESNEQRELNHIKATINSKLSKEVYDHGARFT